VKLLTKPIVTQWSIDHDLLKENYAKSIAAWSKNDATRDYARQRATELKVIWPDFFEILKKELS
jgi:hypothetical protein